VCGLSKTGYHASALFSRLRGLSKTGFASREHAALGAMPAPAQDLGAGRQ